MPLKMEKMTSSNTTPPAMKNLLAHGEQVRNGLTLLPKVVNYLSTKDYGRFKVPRRKEQTCLCTNLNEGTLVGVCT